MVDVPRSPACHAVGSAEHEVVAHAEVREDLGDPGDCTTPWRTMRSGRRRCRSTGLAPPVVSFHAIDPCNGRSRPLIVRNSVVFARALEPMSVTISPAQSSDTPAARGSRGRRDVEIAHLQQGARRLREDARRRGHGVLTFGENRWQRRSIAACVSGPRSRDGLPQIRLDDLRMRPPRPVCRRRSSRHGRARRSAGRWT